MALIEKYRDPADAAMMTVVVYGVWFFLGNFGVHRFITGRAGSGFLMLMMALVGGATVWLLGLGLLILVPLWIWWLYDAFQITRLASLNRTRHPDVSQDLVERSRYPAGGPDFRQDDGPTGRPNPRTGRGPGWCRRVRGWSIPAPPGSSPVLRSGGYI